MKHHTLKLCRALCRAPVTALFLLCLAASAQAATATSMGGASSAAAVEVRMAMRQLWEEHIVYTRNYIISDLADLPDKDAVAQRLLRNQDDIGNAIKPYYGDEAQLAAAQEKWTANGKEIAGFLSGANPNWPKATLEEMLQKHLDLTSGEVVGRLNKDWEADIKAYDEGHAHMLMFADALTDGIAKQFPDKFK